MRRAPSGGASARGWTVQTWGTSPALRAPKGLRAYIRRMHGGSPVLVASRTAKPAALRNRPQKTRVHRATSTQASGQARLAVDRHSPRAMLLLAPATCPPLKPSLSTSTRPLQSRSSLLVVLTLALKPLLVRPHSSTLFRGAREPNRRGEASAARQIDEKIGNRSRHLRCRNGQGARVRPTPRGTRSLSSGPQKASKRSSPRLEKRRHG